MSNFFTGTNSGGNSLEVTDGTTTNLDVRKIIVSAGTITASSGHTVTITTGGGGGGTVTSITAGKDLATGVNPITTSGVIDLEFDAPTVAPGGALLPNGFQNFPPPDIGVVGLNAPPSGNLIGGGWVKVNISGVGDAWIPYWIAGP